MQFDFSRIDDIDSFISIPEGRYACRVAEVREGVSRDGSPRWSLRLEVAAGDYAGRTAGWDSVTWSERGIRRVKHVLEALGLDVSGQVEIVPADLLGREVLATFQSEEREDAFTGRRVLRLRVPYAGYQPFDPRTFGASAFGATQSDAHSSGVHSSDARGLASHAAGNGRGPGAGPNAGPSAGNGHGSPREHARDAGAGPNHVTAREATAGAGHGGRDADERSPAGFDEEFED